MPRGMPHGCTIPSPSTPHKLWRRIARHTHASALLTTCTAGFSAPHMTCTSLYAYYWMMVAFEFAVLCGLALAAAGHGIACMRLAWVGLLAVVSALYIQGADSFVAVTSVLVRAFRPRLAPSVSPCTAVHALQCRLRSCRVRGT